ncbi:hypothetical protein FLA_3434 [Filimonas lacunae]|nr:hypothetical protein FLA_3434 [Filimonas lacunae]
MVQKKNPADFVPKGYVFFEKVTGDLDKDSLEDCVLIIKGTDKSRFVNDEYRGKLDRNRRGVMGGMAIGNTHSDINMLGLS